MPLYHLYRGLPPLPGSATQMHAGYIRVDESFESPEQAIRHATASKRTELRKRGKLTLSEAHETEATFDPQSYTGAEWVVVRLDDDSDE